MKLTTDPENNVGYFALCPIEDGEVAHSIATGKNIILDFDTKGALQYGRRLAA